MKKSISVIAIVGLLAWFVTRQACTPTPLPPGVDTTVVIKHDTIYVEHVVERTNYLPGGVIYKPFTDTLYEPVDSLAILKDYLATRIYNDTVKIDTVGWAYIKDSISKNQVLSRHFTAKYTLPVITKTETVIITPAPKSEFYLGAEGLYSKTNPIQYYGPVALLKTKNNHIYTLGTGFVIGQGFGLKAGVLWKIKNK